MTTKALTLQIPMELHKELKLLAVSTGTTMKDLIIEVIKKLIKKNTSKEKIAWKKKTSNVSYKA